MLEDTKGATNTRERNSVLHEIDYEDVNLTRHSLKIVLKAARTMISRYMPAAPDSKLSLKRSLAMFIDHVFWDERTGGLFMCANLGSLGVCLPIPKSDWSVRLNSSPVQ